jgi:hypothetical protein
MPPGPVHHHDEHIHAVHYDGELRRAPTPHSLCLRSRGNPHSPRTPARQRRNLTCGHCASPEVTGWACDQGAALRAARLRRSRPHPHPKGTPRLRSGAAQTLQQLTLNQLGQKHPSLRLGGGKPRGHPSPKILWAFGPPTVLKLGSGVTAGTGRPPPGWGFAGSADGPGLADETGGACRLLTSVRLGPFVGVPKIERWSPFTGIPGCRLERVSQSPFSERGSAAGARR